MVPTKEQERLAGIAAMDATHGKAVAINAPTVFTDGILATMGSYEDALRVFESNGIQLESMDDYGTGFKVLADKASLVSVPFLIIEWRVTESKTYSNTDGTPAKFVSAMVVTKHGEKFIVNDGSTGICAQLIAVQETREAKGHANPQVGLLCPAGLTRSEYKNADGQPGVTYYLSD